jgi:hypothetical protein
MTVQNVTVLFVDATSSGGSNMKTIALGFSVLCSAGATLATTVPANAATGLHCVVLEVASFDNRVHIRAKCDYSPVPTYVAVESNSPMAATTVQVGLYAMTGKHFVNIFYDENVGANPAGCNQDDCRRLIGLIALAP